MITKTILDKRGTTQYDLVVKQTELQELMKLLKDAYNNKSIKIIFIMYITCLDIHLIHKIQVEYI